MKITTKLNGLAFMQIIAQAMKEGSTVTLVPRAEPSGSGTTCSVGLDVMRNDDRLPIKLRLEGGLNSLSIEAFIETDVLGIGD